MTGGPDGSFSVYILDICPKLTASLDFLNLSSFEICYRFTLSTSYLMKFDKFPTRRSFMRKEMDGKPVERRIRGNQERNKNYSIIIINIYFGLSKHDYPKDK